MAVIQRPCRYCGELFNAKTQRAMFCKDSCRTLYGRSKRSTTKTVTVGRLTLKFEDVSPALTQEVLEAIVHDSLTPEMLAAIYSNETLLLVGDHNA